jgi:hypothetical protein
MSVQFDGDWPSCAVAAAAAVSAAAAIAAIDSLLGPTALWRCVRLEGLLLVATASVRSAEALVLLRRPV